MRWRAAWKKKNWSTLRTQHQAVLCRGEVGTKMANEGFEEEDWDADFIDELVQAEEQALSATQVSPRHPPPLPPPPLPHDVSYSPPRQLSQRTHEISYTANDFHYFDSFAPNKTQFAKENDRLKKELDRVSKKLIFLEQECSELRKEKDKQEEQLHSVICAKGADSKDFVSNHVASCIPQACQIPNSSNKPLDSWTKSACNPIGPQIDKTTESSNLDKRIVFHGSEKLLSLWSSSDQKLGSILVPKLLTTCEVDFHVLFGYLNSSSSSEAKIISPQNCFNTTFSNQPLSSQSIETTTISRLYSMLTKISYEPLGLKDLIENLADLCGLNNVVFVRRSLHVLHTVLSNFFSMENKFDRRENVIIEEHVSEISKSYSDNKGLNFANIAEMLNRAHIPCGLKSSNDKTPGCSIFFNNSFEASISGVYWVSLFERISQIAIKNKEEQIRREALSIMKLILLRSNAYTERDKFAGELVFQSLSQLLRREAGCGVQHRAVDILYLLFNCPKVMAMFCSGLKKDGEPACTEDIDEKGISNSQQLNEILIGLSDCLAYSGCATSKDMKLQRNAILFLAFLGSSGKSAFEILLNYRLPKGTNFLVIILQSLASALDQAALKSFKPSDVFREWSLLIREALIFFNRLVSHPQYSVPVLQSLTNTRDTACMTVDIANRLTNKAKLLWQDDKLAKQIRESEIVELALVFRKRVFTYLGDNI